MLTMAIDDWMLGESRVWRDLLVEGGGDNDEDDDDDDGDAKME